MSAARYLRGGRARPHDNAAHPGRPSSERHTTDGRCTPLAPAPRNMIHTAKRHARHSPPPHATFAFAFARARARRRRRVPSMQRVDGLARDRLEGRTDDDGEAHARLRSERGGQRQRDVQGLAAARGGVPSGGRGSGSESSSSSSRGDSPLRSGEAPNPPTKRGGTQALRGASEWRAFTSFALALTRAHSLALACSLSISFG